MSTKYSFGRISDANVLRLMDELLVFFNVASSSVSIGDITSFSSTKNKEDGLIDGERSQYQDLLTDDSYLISSMTWQAGSSSHSVSYYRQKVWGLNENHQHTWIDAPNPYVDSIEVNSSAQNAAVLLLTVRKHVDMAPPIAAGPEAGSAMDQSQAILNRVSSAVATLVEHTAERQKELDETRYSLGKEAEKAAKANKLAAVAEVKRIEDNFAEKEKALVTREAELDDRANTHVRREFAKQMATLSDTQLSSNLLTKSKSSFWVPLAICMGAVLILGAIVFWELSYIQQFSESIGAIAKDQYLNAAQKTILIGNVNYQILYAQIRIAIQSLGLAALVWFALRMASSRYSLVSGWERDLHRFRLDTERAGFLVEGDLEARKVNQEGLPDVLLESFSRNLFTSSDGGHSASSSEGLGGTLNALLGQAAKVRVGPDGVNVEIEGKGIRKARKLIEEE